MKRLLTLALFATSLAAAPVWAADPQEHSAHHPDAAPAKPAAKAPLPSKPSSGEFTAAQRMQMEKQMTSMQEIHEKFMAAKTPEERAALRDEHMKSMQSGMSMMKEMRGGMPMGKGMGSGMGMGKGMEMGQQQCMEMCMQKRMDMMEMMMQMMVDRTAATPAK